jgi:hypothetical protein
VYVFYELLDIGGVHVGDDRLERDFRIDGGEMLKRRNRLRLLFAGIPLVKNGLPLQVAQFDRIPVDEPNEPNPRTAKAARNDGAQRPEPEDGDPGLQQLPLPLGADPPETV